MTRRVIVAVEEDRCDDIDCSRGEKRLIGCIDRRIGGFEAGMVRRFVRS